MSSHMFLWRNKKNLTTICLKKSALSGAMGCSVVYVCSHLF